MLVAARRGATEWLGATNAHATERRQAMTVERIILRATAEVLLADGRTSILERLA